jgi:hypothetical protein
MVAAPQEKTDRPDSPKVFKLTGKKPVSPIAFSADGKAVFWAEGNEVINVWKPQTGKNARRAWGKLAALSPDGKRIVVVAPDRKAYLLFDADAGSVLHEFAADPDQLLLPECQAAFSPDGKVLALAQFKGTDLWDLTTGKKLRRISGGSVGRLGFSPDGRRLAISIDMGLTLIDLTTGKGQRLFANPFPGTGAREAYCPPFVFLPDGTTLLSGTDPETVISARQNKVRCWDVATGKERPGWPFKEFGVITALVLSPDGKSLAMGRPDGGVWLWETATGTVRARLKEHAKSVYALAFSPDGTALASAGADGAVVACDPWGGAWPKAAWKDLSRDQRDALWSSLRDADAGKAFPALGTLAAAPEEAAAFLGEQLRSIRLPDPARMARLLAQLDDESFAVREKASRQLEQLGDLAEPAMREALKKTESAEVRKRLRGILEKLEGPGTGDRLRVSRAAEVLERLGSPAARKALEALARDAEWPYLKLQAKDALTRLDRRAARKP